MKTTALLRWSMWPALVLSLPLIAPARALAHCDGLDGPVVRAAQKALAARNPALVLMWVQPKDEPEIRVVFEQTLAVRALSREAKELADRYFFETLVRVHRAGEGAPYTGLEPAGRDLGPAIPAADSAIDAESLEPVVKLLTDAMEEKLREHFKQVLLTRAFRPNDVAAGREYVKAYVQFLHYVERLHEAITTSAHGRSAETERAANSR